MLNNVEAFRRLYDEFATCYSSVFLCWAEGSFAFVLMVEVSNTGRREEVSSMIFSIAAVVFVGNGGFERFCVSKRSVGSPLSSEAVAAIWGRRKPKKRIILPAPAEDS